MEEFDKRFHITADFVKVNDRKGNRNFLLVLSLSTRDGTIARTKVKVSISNKKW